MLVTLPIYSDLRIRNDKVHISRVSIWTEPNFLEAWSMIGQLHFELEKKLVILNWSSIFTRLGTSYINLSCEPIEIRSHFGQSTLAKDCLFTHIANN